MKRFSHTLRILAVVLALFLVAGCSAAETTPPTTEPTVPTAPTEPPVVDIGGTQLLLDTQQLDLTAVTYELDALVNAASSLDSVTAINAGTLNAQSILKISDAFPNADIQYQVDLLGQVLSAQTEMLDAGMMQVEQTQELVDALSLLPNLQEINFVSEDGTCVFGLEDLEELDRIQAAVPDAYLRVRFELFGQTVTSEDEHIEYLQADIGNEGIETVRAVLPYLKSCTYFLMDGCGTDYEILAQLRDDFPETEIVWRVWLVEEDYTSKLFLRCGSYLTDTIKIRTTYVNDENSHVLNYCTKTKYVDVGHVWQLSQCDFLSYMPDLEVCIIAITYITDITPLANHDKLEYLELFTTDIADLTPLMSCPNIEHLNISNMQMLTDISPVYTLKKLKRLRMVDSYSIPEEQLKEAYQMLPDCNILDQGHFPTSWGWRWLDPAKTQKDPRYELLCEQFEYAIDGMIYGIP